MKKHHFIFKMKNSIPGIFQNEKIFNLKKIESLISQLYCQLRDFFIGTFFAYYIVKAIYLFFCFYWIKQTHVNFELGIYDFD